MNHTEFVVFNCRYLVNYSVHGIPTSKPRCRYWLLKYDVCSVFAVQQSVNSILCRITFYTLQCRHTFNNSLTDHITDKLIRFTCILWGNYSFSVMGFFGNFLVGGGGFFSFQTGISGGLGLCTHLSSYIHDSKMDAYIRKQNQRCFHTAGKAGVCNAVYSTALAVGTIITLWRHLKQCVIIKLLLSYETKSTMGCVESDLIQAYLISSYLTVNRPTRTRLDKM